MTDQRSAQSLAPGRAPRGGDAAHAARRRRAPRAQGDGLRGAGRAGPRRGARQGDRPPRPQAGEPVRHQRRAREGPRLRPRAAAGARRRGGRHALAHARAADRPLARRQDRRLRERYVRQRRPLPAPGRRTQSRQPHRGLPGPGLRTVVLPGRDEDRVPLRARRRRRLRDGSDRRVGPPRERPGLRPRLVPRRTRRRKTRSPSPATPPSTGTRSGRPTADSCTSPATAAAP